jgi:hypothetical protein
MHVSSASQNRIKYNIKGMKRTLKRVVLTAVLAAAGLASGGGGASASVTVGSHVVGNPGFYDYSPTVIENGPTQDFWWCGSIATHNADTILHAQYSLAGGTARVTMPEQAVLEEGPSGTWDSLYTCNPDVVEGRFANPLGNGVTYTYAMYYVGTSSPNAGNSIGVAFSNDGLNWAKYPSPVLQFSQPAGASYYGYAQPNAYDPGGGSAVTLLYEVATTSSSHVEVTSTDGVHFSSPQTITSLGLPGPTPSWGGVAYDEQDGRWYGAFNDPGRPATRTGGVGERGQPGVTLYATASLTSGTWTPLTTVDTSLTGYEANFIAGLLRQPDGALNASTLPSVEMYVSTSNPRPATTATPAQAGQSADTSNWDIVWSVWTPDNVLSRRSLNRYYSSALGTHEVTTGWVDTSAFHLEGTLGYLYEAPTGIADVPLYSCKAGSSDWFVSLDPNCEGQLYIGLEGYGFAQDGPNEVPLYRCYTGVNHFVSTRPDCEGQKTEQLLGYAGVTALPVS